MTQVSNILTGEDYTIKDVKCYSCESENIDYIELDIQKKKTACEFMCLSCGKQFRYSVVLAIAETEVVIKKKVIVIKKKNE